MILQVHPTAVYFGGRPEILCVLEGVGGWLKEKLHFCGFSSVCMLARAGD